MKFKYSFFLNNLTFLYSFLNLIVCFFSILFADNYYFAYLILLLVHFIFNILIKNNYIFFIASFLNLLIFHIYTIYQHSLGLLVWNKQPFLTDDSVMFFYGMVNNSFSFGQSGVVWSSFIDFIKSLFPTFEVQNILFINYILILLTAIFIFNIFKNLF